MAKNKKKNKSKTKSKHNTGISVKAEYQNLIMIFGGIFLLYSLHSKSMGIIGDFIQSLFLGLFGQIAMIMPFIIIVIGLLGFFEKNEYIHKIRQAKFMYIMIFFIFLFYGLLNRKYLPVDSPFEQGMLKDVFTMPQTGKGSGVIATILAYYAIQVLGVTGAWLVSLFIFAITILIIFDISLRDLIYSIKAFTTTDKEKFKNLSLKEKAKNLKESVVNIVTDEVDEKTMHKPEKNNMLKKLFNKEKENEDDVIAEDENDKTIKIVGFNKAEDDYLEILEGTQSMPELEQLKELQQQKKNTDIQKKPQDLEDSLEATKALNMNIETTYENYKKPTIELLNKIDNKTNENGKKKVLKNASMLEKTLSDFGVEASVNQVTVGPTITRYEIQPSPGVKVSKIVNLTDDIALSLAAKSIRMEAPIPGKSAIGIEVPNEEPQMVGFREILESEEFKKFESPLAMGLGKDIAGKTIIADIGKMPHLLIAGSTGSGKSVCVNTLINSILYKANPDEVKFLMIDPKVVELANYNGIPHLLIPVVTDPKKAANALNWAVTEMNTRYKMFAQNGVKDITGYNQKCEEKLPKIVIIIDELADLMMVSANDVEDSICRLAQMARAAGMHLIVATQRPSVDIITGVIKANIPSRIAFAVSSQADSRTILDMGGAEKLLGKGDMLFYPLGSSKPVRLQGAFISEDESERVIEYIKEQCNPEEITYEESIIENISKVTAIQSEDNDEMLQDAIEFVVDSGQASASMLQRKFRIGFNRAARLIDAMEERGIVGASEGSKPRKTLLTKEELMNLEGE